MWVSSLFQLVLYSTVLGSTVALCILLLKLLIHDKLGVHWNYWIWLVLIVRLLIPYAPQSSLSLFNILDFNKSTISQIDNMLDTNEKPPEITSNVIKNDESQFVIDSKNSNTKITSTSSLINSKDFIFKLLIIVWLVGVVILSIFTVSKTIAFYIKLKNQKLVIDEEYTEVLNRCKQKMKINTKISVLRTNLIKTPAIFGSIHPKLLLPIGIESQVSMEELEFIILHEMAHLKRKDISLGYVIHALQIIHWFNPILWYSFYRMRQDMELACDALALSCINSNDCVKYGKTIIKLLENYKKTTKIYGMEGIINNKSQIKRRITMISLFKKSSFKITAVSLIVILAVSGVLLTNSKTNAEADSDKEQIEAKADIDETPIVQEETQKDVASTEPNKEVASAPVQEQGEKENVSTNKEEVNKQNIKETTTKVNNSQATTADSQTKVNANNKKDDFSGIEAAWKSFRNAVLSNNMSQVKKMTQFPLSTRGPMDSDPIVKFNQDKFDKVFQALLNESNGSGDGTVLSYIQDNENLIYKNRADYENSGNYAKTIDVENNTARFNMMVFRLINGEWKLTFIYLDYDAYKEIG